MSQDVGREQRRVEVVSAGQRDGKDSDRHQCPGLKDMKKTKTKTRTGTRTKRCLRIQTAINVQIEGYDDDDDDGGGGGVQSGDEGYFGDGDH